MSEEKVFDEVKRGLEFINYSISQNDEALIRFFIKSCDEYIKNFCGTQEVADGLFYAEVKSIIGEFLMNKKACGSLEIEGLELGEKVKSLQEGDITITYSDDSLCNEQKFDELINNLIFALRKEIVNYRCLKW